MAEGLSPRAAEPNSSADACVYCSHPHRQAQLAGGKLTQESGPHGLSNSLIAYEVTQTFV